jgi:hypothetical protein
VLLPRGDVFDPGRRAVGQAFSRANDTSKNSTTLEENPAYDSSPKHDISCLEVGFPFPSGHC